MNFEFANCPENFRLLPLKCSNKKPHVFHACREDKKDCIDSLLLFIPIYNVISLVESLEPHAADRVLIDARENRFYQTKHLRGAVNFSCHSKIMTKHAKRNWSNLYGGAELVRKIYIYDNKSSRTSSTSPMSANLHSFSDFLTRLGHQVFVLNGGWVAIQAEFEDRETLFETSIERDLLERYSTSPTSNASPCVDVLNAMASEIEDFLYLGNERDSQDFEMLSSLGITHILNVTNDVKNAFEEELNAPNKVFGGCKFTYLRLPASDNHAQDLYKFFDCAYEFIESARRQPNGRVLVHCWAGVSRSATIVIAYLMRHYCSDVQHCLERVSARRPIIAPNLNFMGQLDRFYHTKIQTQISCDKKLSNPLTSVDECYCPATTSSSSSSLACVSVESGESSRDERLGSVDSFEMEIDGEAFSSGASSFSSLSDDSSRVSSFSSTCCSNSAVFDMSINKLALAVIPPFKPLNFNDVQLDEGITCSERCSAYMKCSSDVFKSENGSQPCELAAIG